MLQPLRPEFGPVPVFLAPMSGVTDRPFRRLVRRLADVIVVSEMVASRQAIELARRNLQDRSRRLTTRWAEEGSMVVQLAGIEPGDMAEAARLNVDRGAAVIDLNFGCPAKKIVNGQLGGSALMRDEGRAARIIEAVVRAVEVPVTVKMRTGWDADSRNAPSLARLAQDCGARMLTVHGRTRCQFYQGEADWAFIGEVKKAVQVPVIANGDIRSTADARACLAASGTDGVMIGRAAQGRPWMLASISAALNGRPVPGEPSLAEKLRLIAEHFEDMLLHYGREAGARIARKHLGWYAGALPEGKRFRDLAMRATDGPGLCSAMQTLYGDAAEPSLVLTRAA